MGGSWDVYSSTENDGVSSGWHQVERHGRTQSMASSSNSSSGEVTERSGLGVSSAGSFFWSGSIAGRGGQVWSPLVGFSQEWMMNLFLQWIHLSIEIIFLIELS